MKTVAMATIALVAIPVFIVLMAKLVTVTATAVLQALPALIILWFVLLVLRAIVRSLLR